MVGSQSTVSAKSHWIIVADEAEAHFFSREGKFGPLLEFSLLQNETAREKLGNLYSDSAGRGFDNQGQGRHAYAKDKSDPKKQSYAVFAKSIAERISASMKDNRISKLVVIAAPRFLGVLRKALEQVNVKADLTIDKEVTGRDAAFIRTLLDEHEKKSSL
ncbi:MAG: host attachment protein [Proteobacteria bacterium]|nr:host attachment protein [Pseudomonadota bacterium]MDA0994349.1 host attachment protein [Pseudomonadota bacterium]